MHISNYAKKKTHLFCVCLFLTGEQIVNDYTHKVVIKEDGTQSLIIVPASPSDSGEWTVVAQNRAGKSTISVTLTVEGKPRVFFIKTKADCFFMSGPNQALQPPAALNHGLSLAAVEHQIKPAFVEKLKNVNIKEGARLEMKVRATGNPNPDIVWLKNSDIIVPHKYPRIRSV